MSAATMLPAEITTRGIRFPSGFSKPVISVKNHLLKLPHVILDTFSSLNESLYGKVKMLKRGVSLTIEKIAYIATMILEKIAYIMAAFYSLSGFEKLSKSIIAHTKLWGPIFGISSLLREFLKTIEAQKDVYYATLWINSTAEFIHEAKDKNGKPILDPKTHKRQFTVQIPRQVNGKRDWVKVCYAIGNFIELGKFLDKTKVYTFDTLKKIARGIGSFPLFDLNGKMYNLERIPVLSFFYKFLCKRPKDAFMFVGISNEIWRFSNDLYKHFKDPGRSPIRHMSDFFLKFVNAVGKICLISFSKYHYLWQFKLAEVITNDASLWKFILEHHRKQEEAKRPKIVKIALPVGG